MDDSTLAGRGHRQKIPTDKVREHVPGLKTDKNEDNRQVVIPTYIAPNDAKFLSDPPELAKLYDHSKVGANGDRTEFFQLGTHLEGKEKRVYLRTKRDPNSMYFRTAEASPHHARLSDENHPQCAVEGLKNCFTKDMLGKSGEMGSYTTRANVFAREGQFFFEAKIISQAPPGRERPDAALADTQNQERSSVNRGGIRVGFCRREHHWSESMGGNAYSYAVVCRCGTGLEYGNGRFNTTMHHLSGEGGRDPGDLVPGDVVGLMITLPPLEVQQKVVEGTFNPADYPHLKCGPANIKPKKGAGNKKSSKAPSKPKDANPTSTKEDNNTSRKSASRAYLRADMANNPYPLPADQDIIRDRNPFLFKGLAYYECPDYTPHPDLSRPTLNAKSKSVNPETGKKYDLTTEPHPNHELPHLRTLPGSKIELWVNGQYHGIVWEHLFAFLPPASTIEKSSRTSLMHGDIDDGLLGYYPAISHYTGGAVECKFDGPWWYGYGDDDNGPRREECRPIGERYSEQIVEDLVSDLVDEVYQEQLWRDEEWMRKRVLQGGGGLLPGGMLGFGGGGGAVGMTTPTTTTMS